MQKIKISTSSITFNIFLILILVLAYFIRELILISLIGIGIGTLLTPLLKKLHTIFKFPRSLSALIVLLALILITAGVLASIYYLVSDQFNSLAERSPSRMG